MANQLAVHKEAHDLLGSETASDAIALAADAAKGLSMKKTGAELEEAVEKFEKDWELATQGDFALSSAMGTHQSMLEIYGPRDSGMRVVWMTLEDPKVCQYCDKASKNSDGTYKYYKMSDFKPAGYNYGKKKADWQLVIPPGHPRCRCTLLYCPSGFAVDPNGSIRSKKS